MTKAKQSEIRLVKPDLTHEAEVMDYKKEFEGRQDNMAGSSYLGDYDDYKKWLTFVYDNEDERTAIQKSQQVSISLSMKRIRW